MEDPMELEVPGTITPGKKQYESTIALTGAQVKRMRESEGYNKQKTLSSPKIGVLKFTCACGRQTTANEQVLKNALGIDIGKTGDPVADKVYLEGSIYEVGKNLRAGDLVFLVDNPNAHNYPLGTIIIYGADQKESKGLYLFNGVFRTGNSLPTNRMYKPTRVHKDLVSNNPLLMKLLETQGAEIFGKPEKETVPRKSSRRAKTKYL